MVERLRRRNQASNQGGNVSLRDRQGAREERNAIVIEDSSDEESGSAAMAGSSKRRRMDSSRPASARKICVICQDDLNEQHELCLQLGCGCTHHWECLSNYLKFEMKEQKVPFTCPTVKGDGPTSSSSSSAAAAASGGGSGGGIVRCKQMQASEVQIMLEEADFIRYSELLIERLQGTQVCTGPDCGYRAFLGDDARLREEGVGFPCPKCEQMCLVCGLKVHKGMTCVQAKATQDTNSSDRKNEQAFKDYQNENRTRKCPDCGAVIEKVEGCDKMRCRCGAKFCYQCGARNATCGCTSKFHGFFDTESVRNNWANWPPTRSTNMPRGGGGGPDMANLAALLQQQLNDLPNIARANMPPYFQPYFPNAFGGPAAGANGAGGPHGGAHPHHSSAAAAAGAAAAARAHANAGGRSSSARGGGEPSMFDEMFAALVGAAGPPRGPAGRQRGQGARGYLG